jgi:cytochrome c oxidase cbb3-type subunit 4
MDTNLWDINLWRIVMTVLSFACFIGIVVWAWSDRNRTGFDEAAHLPFEQD